MPPTSMYEAQIMASLVPIADPNRRRRSPVPNANAQKKRPPQDEMASRVIGLPVSRATDPGGCG
jgi:hypothetical protein